MRVTTMSLAASVSRVWTKYLQSMYDGGSHTKVNDKPRYATFTHPGLPLWAYDTNPVAPNLIDVIRVTEDCMLYGALQTVPEQGNQTLDLCKEMRECGYWCFQTDLELTFSKALYDPAVPKWPVRAYYGHGYRAGSLVTYQTGLKAYCSDVPLVTMTCSAAFVNRETRKVAKSLPEWFKSSLDGKEILDKGLRIGRLPKRSNETFKEKKMVLLSDMDENGHANFKTYMNKSYETLRHVITMKEFSHTAEHSSAPENCRGQVIPQWLTSSIVSQGMKCLKAKFIKECLPGDEVCIHVWQEDNPRLALFSMEREEGHKTQVLCEISMEFFEPSSKL
ncbi:elongator complex protein 5-like [Plakobranchus ocellatus]|uniref:Elongator complex protein 5-like n=1 Tax=Plakobranchus ocellatus TaxID=259542 RepID=A0AAV3YZ79_9GAST|nr:elongator complex protein 5-like [Plakobranchus ocellatus]